MAVTKDGVIGYKNAIPWYYPKDLKHFRETVAGSTVIMGRKTYEATPETALKGCTKIVLTRNPHFKAKGYNIVHSIEECMQFIQSIQVPKPIYIIGGANIAKQFLELGLIDNFLLTIISKSYPGDTFFDLTLLAKWSKTEMLSTDDYTVVLFNRP